MSLSFVSGSFLLSVVPLALAAQAGTSKPRTDSETVVFVCEHGSVKSVVALAYFTQLARERHLPIRAISRGTAPDTAVPYVVREGLRRDGLTLGPFTPTRFTAVDLASAITVISFDQAGVAGLVAGRVPTGTWDGLPAVSENYPVARDSIRARVVRLVDSLTRARARKVSPHPR
jgi:hypothetical protein